MRVRCRAALLGLIILTGGYSSRSAAAQSVPRQRIDESTFVTLGGLEQYITIHGDRRSNLILLVVHGGPGDPQSPFRAEYSAYEHDFTVVQWDQRGSGRTFGRYKDRTPNLTLEQIVSDGVELAQYLTRHLTQNKILVLGHSWGSVVATEMVQKRPELFAAYIGTGQVGSWDRGLRFQKDFVRKRAGDEGNQEAVSAIDSIQNFDPGNLQHFLAVNRFLRGYFGKADREWLSSLRDRTQRATSPAEAQEIGAGMNLSGQALYPAVIREDLFAGAKNFQVPVYVIQGREDVSTPTPVATDYFNSIQAPSKKLFVIDEAGHFALVTHQTDFLRILQGIVREVRSLPN